MATPSATSEPPSSARRTPSSHRPGQLHRQPDAAGHGVDGDGASALRPRHGSNSIDTSAATSMPGVVGVYTARRPGGRRPAVRVADHRGHQDPGALPADEGQDPLPRRRGRRGRGRDARAGARRRGERLGRRDRAAGRHRPRGRDGRRCAADPRGAGTERHRPLESRRRRGPGHLRHRTRHRPGALPPAALDPQRDRAAWLPGVVDPGAWASSRCGAPHRSRTSPR